jgi:hypothetical protein
MDSFPILYRNYSYFRSTRNLARVDGDVVYVREGRESFIGEILDFIAFQTEINMIEKWVIVQLLTDEKNIRAVLVDSIISQVILNSDGEIYYN